MEAAIGSDHSTVASKGQGKVQAVVDAAVDAAGDLEGRLEKALRGVQVHGNGEEPPQDVSSLREGEFSEADLLPENVAELGEKETNHFTATLASTT